MCCLHINCWCLHIILLAFDLVFLYSDKLHPYHFLPRLKRMQRLKAYAEGQRKIRYECRKVLADNRPRIRGRFVKECDSGPMSEGPSGMMMEGPTERRLVSPPEACQLLPPSQDGSTCGGHGGSSLTSQGASQLLLAMSKINLEAVAVAISKNNNMRLSGRTSNNSRHQRSLLASPSVITDHELNELGAMLGSTESNKVWIHSHV